MSIYLKNKLTITIIFIIVLSQTLYSNLNENKIPKKIISLSPVITESIYLLEADKNIIANTIYCTRPEQAKDKIKIGSLLELNLEKIISLNPDLILASSLTHPKDLEKLKNLGFHVEQFNYAKSFNEICEQFIYLGKLINKQEKSIKIINETKKQVELLKKITASKNKKKVFMQVGVKPLFTVGKDTFINDYIEFSGGINIASDSKEGIYSREKVIASNPDIIFIVLMGIEGDKEKKIWENYKNINAVKNNNIHIIDSYEICSPTPLIFIKTLKKLIKIIHPDIKIKE